MSKDSDILNTLNSPNDLKNLDDADLGKLCQEIRTRIIDATSQNGGHVGPNLGVVELTVALHLAFVFGHLVVLFLQGKLSGVTLREGVAHSRYQSRDAFANVTQQLCSSCLLYTSPSPRD